MSDYVTILVKDNYMWQQRGDRAFAVAASRLWNQLPSNIRYVPTISTFKSGLKTHLYSLAFLLP